ncbi:MAG: ABC transporter ATP-binding protein [Eubacteriales bacterium]|nr:ABC transporter ATP-binding protein [Eubacteriales bacterium]
MAKKKSQPGEPKQGLSRLMELAMTKKAPMVSGIILSVLATVASFVPYLAIYFVIREIVGVYPDFNDLNVTAVLGYGALALGGVLVNVLLYTASVALSHLAAYGTLYELKISFVSHITKLPLGYHLNTGSGKLRKIMDDNIESLEGFIAHDLPNMVSAFVSPVVMLVLLFAVDWRFGLATLLGIIVAFVLYGATSGGNTTQQLMTDYQASLENMSNASVEYIRGISVVKAFRQTAFSFKRLYDSIKNYTATVIPYSLSQELMTATLTAALNAIYLFLIPIGILVGSHTQDYQSFAATFIFYLIFVPAVAAILMKVIYAMVNTMQISGSVARLDQIMTEPEMKEGTYTEKPENYDIVFENVTFSYTKDGPAALKDISFTARQGEVTAIVGPSGGGKSTIANLIPRFYDVEQGAIKIGGIDVRDMESAALMETVSFVFQDNFLFKQSIMDNIRMGRPDATEDEVIAAAKAARCDDFISELPNGYQTIFGKEGVKLSGGQIQRIAIARAIVKNAPVLVLDEATSFSDPENEHLIQQALNELMKGKTVIMIAHRLSTIRNANQILVIDSGELVQTGTHEDLVQQPGKYLTLWENYTQALRWKMARPVAEEAKHPAGIPGCHSAESMKGGC